MPWFIRERGWGALTVFKTKLCSPGTQTCWYGLFSVFLLLLEPCSLEPEN